MSYKVAEILVKRGLCKFNEIAKLVADGEVLYYNSSGNQNCAVAVDNPDQLLEIPEKGYIDVYVLNRGKTRVYDPYFQGNFLTVTRYDDAEGNLWEVVERHNAIVAVPVIHDKIVLIQVYRHALGVNLLEVPAGIMEPWEQAHDTALRELEEETGYIAGRVDKLFTAFSTPGYSTEGATFYLCTDLELGEQKLDKEEKIVPVAVTIDDAVRLIEQGKIIDMKTISAVCYLAAKLGIDTGRPSDAFLKRTSEKSVNGPKLPCVQSDLIL